MSCAMQPVVVARSARNIVVVRMPPLDCHPWNQHYMLQPREESWGGDGQEERAVSILHRGELFPSQHGGAPRASPYPADRRPAIRHTPARRMQQGPLEHRSIRCRNPVQNPRKADRQARERRLRLFVFRLAVRCRRTGRNLMMSDNAKPPTATMATPDMTWTLDLPERLRLAVADAVVIFSRIDNALIEGIWVLEEADPKRKRQIAKARAHENIGYVKGVVAEHLKLDIEETWNALDQMRQERNLISHGVWMMRFGGDGPNGKPVTTKGLPHVLWHSKMLEEDDYVVAEAFDFW